MAALRTSSSPPSNQTPKHTPQRSSRTPPRLSSLISLEQLGQIIQNPFPSGKDYRRDRPLPLFTVVSAFPDLPELRADPAGFDRHHDRLHGPNLLVRNSLFPGDAKIGFHSRITGCRHRSCEVDQQRGFLIEDLVVAGGFVELTKGPVLFFWKHRALLLRVYL